MASSGNAHAWHGRSKTREQHAAEFLVVVDEIPALEVFCNVVEHVVMRCLRQLRNDETLDIIGIPGPVMIAMRCDSYPWCDCCEESVYISNSAS